MPSPRTPLLAALAVFGAAHADAEPPGKLASGPHLRVVAASFEVGSSPLGPARGSAVLTPDGRQVLLVDAAAVHVVEVGTRKPRQLLNRTSRSFRPTPDSRFLIVGDEPFTRLSLRGQASPVKLAPGQRSGASPSLAVSNSHVAFVNEGGTVIVADLEGKGSVVVDLATPQDGRCHRGAGVPRTFSPDGSWLTVQHGCDHEYLVETRRGGLYRLPFVSSMFIDGKVVGSPNGHPGMANEVVVLDPGTHESWVMPEVSYSPFRVAVPGRLAFLQAFDGRLELVDLAAKKVTRLDEGVGGVTGFISTSPDGRRGFFSVHAADHCSINVVDLTSGTRQLLARVEAGQQCFVKPLTDGHAVGYVWRTNPTEAILLHVEVTTGAVRQLGPPVNTVGSLHAAGGSILVSGSGDFFGAP